MTPTKSSPGASDVTYATVLEVEYHYTKVVIPLGTFNYCPEKGIYEVCFQSQCRFKIKKKQKPMRANKFNNFFGDSSP